MNDIRPCLSLPSAFIHLFILLLFLESSIPSLPELNPSSPANLATSMYIQYNTGSLSPYNLRLTLNTHSQDPSISHFRHQRILISRPSIFIFILH